MVDRKKLILFDFDGVIVDSFEYCLKINQTQHPKMTAELYRTIYEGNFYEVFSKMTSPEDFNEESKKDYWQKFMQRIDEIFPFIGISGILAELKKNYRLAIVSSSTSEAIGSILERENLLGYFAKIYGHEIGESKVEKFKMVFRDFKVKSSDCIFVTDTLGDLIEAERVGIPCIAVSWGFHDAKTLEKGKYKALIHQPDQLVAEIEKHFQANGKWTER